MNVNVEQTGTSYNFSVSQDDWSFSGNVDKRNGNININGNINYAQTVTPSPETGAYPMGGNVGSFNYSYNSNMNTNNSNININLNDSDDEEDLFPLIYEVISSIKTEIAENN